MGGIVIAAIGIVAIWSLGWRDVAWEEFVVRGTATALIIVALPWVYWSKLISIPARRDAEHAKRIRELETDLETAVDIIFNEQKNVSFIADADVPVDGVLVQAPLYWYSIDVRARSRLQRARGVTVRLIDVEFEESGEFLPTGFGGPLPLRWAYSGEDFEPRDVDDVGFTVDLLSIDKPHNKVFVKWKQPTYLRNEKLFDQPGVYRLTLDAQPNEGIRTIKQLTMIWKGQWNDIEVTPICPTANT